MVSESSSQFLKSNKENGRTMVLEDVEKWKKISLVIPSLSFNHKLIKELQTEVKINFMLKYLDLVDNPLNQSVPGYSP